MSAELHRRAERLMETAERLIAEGRMEEALRSYQEASKLEEQALAAVPASRPKTRGILAISAVSLLIQAKQEEAARRLAHRFLAISNLSSDAEDFLFQIALDGARARQVERQDRRLAGESFIVTLRGPTVQVGGLAPLDAVILKMQQFRNYTIRVGEWSAHMPFRQQGPAAEETRRIFTPLISPAFAGSYEFELLFAAPLQLPLFGVNAVELTTSTVREFTQVLETAAQEPSRLASHVEDPSYRRLFLKIIQAMSPTGRDFTEVEVMQARARTSLVLRPEMRSAISDQLQSEQPPSLKTELPATRTGVLRGLNLNKNWLMLVENGVEQQYYVQPGQVFDDVVGPYVNHAVMLTGVLTRTGRFKVVDITEATDSDKVGLR